MQKILFISSVLLLLSICAPAYAYLDPGTGGMLVQGLLAGFAGALAVLKIYWQRLKDFFCRWFARKSHAEKKLSAYDDHADGT